MQKFVSIKYILFGFLVVLIGIGVTYSSNLYRLYTAVTLYDEDKITRNFLTLYESFNANQIPASQTPYMFPEKLSALPAEFLDRQQAKQPVNFA